MKPGTRHLSFSMPLRAAICMISLVLYDPNFALSAEKYYYLHVSSFRLKKNAVQDAVRLQNKGYNAITRHEEVLNKGYWYRVYVGPFSSPQEARLNQEELRKKRLVAYAAIHEKDRLLLRDSEKIPEREKKAAEREAARVVLEAGKPEELPPQAPKKPSGEPTPHEKPPEAKKPPVPISPLEERRAVQHPPPLPIAEPPAEITVKPIQKQQEVPQKGSGRNMRRGGFSLGLRHTYREVETELTKRTRITSDGSTTTTEEVSQPSGEKEDFLTSLHMDSLCLRLGLTGYLEIFAEIGGAYQELSDVGLVYGGGLRLNLFEVKSGLLRGLYGALQGEYLSGEVAYEYDTSSSHKWKKDAEWEEFCGKGELGVARSWGAVYLGADYFYYNEDTERQLLEGLHSSTTSYVLQDELEQKSFGAYGGITFGLTPSLFLNIEGHAFSQNSISGTLEYHF